jgi:hypothetical protein
MQDSSALALPEAGSGALGAALFAGPWFSSFSLHNSVASDGSHAIKGIARKVPSHRFTPRQPAAIDGLAIRMHLFAAIGAIGKSQKGRIRSPVMPRHPAQLLMALSLALLFAHASSSAGTGELDAMLRQAKALGAPMAAVARAIDISRQPAFTKKDVLAVFDISQPSSKMRFYVFDFAAGEVTAHYAAHGRHNGPNGKATKFKGFQSDLDMVPLGPLKTAHSEVMDHYKTIVDRYDGKVYRDLIVVVLEGAAPFNSYINHTPPYKWIIHPNWYTTAGFRAKNNGVLGRSNGCITIDPVENNALITRLQDGALVYVTVGDSPIEQYL